MKHLNKFFLIIFCSIETIRLVDIECNTKYEYERLCSCKTRYSRYNLTGPEILPPASNYTYCDNDDLKYHACYKENCVERCNKSIRELNNIDEFNRLTQLSGNKICTWLGNKSFTENGLTILVESTPGICPPEYDELTHRVCCNMRCACNVKLDGVKLVDLTDRLPKKESFYDCKRSEFEECENDCRQQASIYLEHNPYLLNKTSNSINIFENDKIADQFCVFANKKINYPGSLSTLEITTAPGELSLTKNVNLGSLCCQRECKCEFKDANSNLIYNLTNLLTNKLNKYYDCTKQFLDCKKECMNIADSFLSKNNSTYTNQVEYLNMFETNIVESNGANELCKSINRNSNRPGTDIILNIESEQKEISNYGKLCCKRPCKCDLIAKNFGFLIQEFTTIEQGSKLIKDLTSFLPSRNLSYDCSKESDNCMKDCKIAAGTFLNSDKLKTSAETLQSLDLFFEFKAATKICETFNKQINSPGVEVYLRYDTKSSLFKSTEDLYIGRICCNDFLFPANKCKYPVLPDIQG